MKWTDWKKLDFPSETFRRTVTIHGRTIGVAVSPYDIPEAVRFAFERETSVMTMQFRYINNEEETRHVLVPPDINVEIGKMSNRAYTVTFHVDHKAITPGSQELERRMQEVAQSISDFARGQLKEANSDMVQTAIRLKTSGAELAL